MANLTPRFDFFSREEHELTETIDRCGGDFVQSLDYERTRAPSDLVLTFLIMAAFGRRSIPAGGVAPRSNMPNILGRRALPAGRIGTLDASSYFGTAH
jgi:hypothetical protein